MSLAPMLDDAQTWTSAMHKLEPVIITANAQDLKENTSMRSPKLLPWYARKAGVSIDRAEELWQKAVREATEKAGWGGKAECSGEAMHGFIELLEHERDAVRYPSGMYSLEHRQSRLWKLPLTVMVSVFNA